MKLSRSVVSLLGALLLVGLLVAPATAADESNEGGYPEPGSEQPDDDGYPEPETPETEEPVVDDDVVVDDDEEPEPEPEVIEVTVDTSDEEDVSALAFTGSNTTPLVLGGLVLLMLGSLLLIVARRHASED